MNRYFALSVGGGFLSAALFLAMALGAPFGTVLALFSQIPLFAVGLGLGTPAAILACAAAAAIMAGTAGLPVAGSFLAATAVPITLIVHLVLQSRTSADGTTEWYPPGYALCWLTALGVIFVGGVALWYSGAEGGIEGMAYRWMLGNLKGAEEAALAAGTQKFFLSATQMESLARSVARVLPAGVVIVSMLLLVLNAAFAQRLLVRAGKNMRPTAPLAALELPMWPTLAIAAAAALSLASGQIGMVAQNMMMILAIPFLFQGLAVIHAYAQRWQGRSFALALIYLVLIFMQWPAVLVAGLGFVEQWVHLRSRMAARNAGQEEE